MNKELIKTSLDEIDKNEENLLFIGDWCRLQHLFNNDDDRLIDNPIDVKQTIKINKEAKIVTEMLLSEITKLYNKNFNLNENERYYKIIIGRWLFHFINNVLEKNILLKNAKKLHPNISTKTRYFVNELSIDSMSYYLKSYSSHLFNHKMFSSIINLKNDYIKINIKSSKANIKNKQNIIFYRKIKENIKPLFGKILLGLNRFFSDDLILVVDPYYIRGYFFNSIWFFLKSKGKIVHKEFNLSKSKSELNYLLRDKFNSMISKSDNELLNISSNILFKFIPICYLEDFIELRNKAEKWHLNNSNCNKFFTANSIHTNEFFKYLVAFNQKIPLSILQHGYGYGSSKIISGEEYENSLADKYYTWGWGDLKLPHPKLLQRKKINYKNNTKILFTFPSIRIYSGLLESVYLHSISKQKIIEDSNKVIKGLNPRIKSFMFKRETKLEYLITMKLQTNLKVDKIKNFHSSLCNSKIHLTNHLGTPFLESMAMNIPTVLILSNFKDYLRDEVVNIFLELKHANIIFDNPKLASTHINKYYDSIDDWWLKGSTQSLVKKFNSKFCISHSNWKNIWLNELIKEN